MIPCTVFTIVRIRDMFKLSHGKYGMVNIKLGENVVPAVYESF